MPDPVTLLCGSAGDCAAIAPMPGWCRSDYDCDRLARALNAAGPGSSAGPGTSRRDRRLTPLLLGLHRRSPEPGDDDDREAGSPSQAAAMPPTAVAATMTSTTPAKRNRGHQRVRRVRASRAPLRRAGLPAGTGVIALLMARRHRRRRHRRRPGECRAATPPAASRAAAPGDRGSQRRSPSVRASRQKRQR